MKNPHGIRRPTFARGFTIIETVVSVAILTMIGITGSQLILRTSQKATATLSNKRAALLGEMAIEKYNSYGVANYSAMSTHDATTPLAAEQFFGAPMPGFERFLLTSKTVYSANLSSATVTVTILWTQGAQQKTLIFTKVYGATVALVPGASVPVWVKWIDPSNAACVTSVTNFDIIANCPGISGINVFAQPASPGAPVKGTANAQGGVVLSGVAVGASISFTVTGNPPSAYNVAPGPSFTQGYYATVSPGNFSLSITTTAAITNSPSQNTLVITNFMPAGTLGGTIINDSSAGGPVDAVTVQLSTGAWVGTGTAFTQVSVPFNPQTTSDAGGHYAFYNVLPENNPGVAPIGRAGSPPQIQLSDPGFLYAYTGVLPYYAAGGWNSAVMPPVATADAHIIRDGWFKVKVVSSIDNSNIANEAVTTKDMKGDVAAVSTQSDSNGELKLYNLLTANNTAYYFFSYRGPQSGVDRGFFANPTWSCPGSCLDQENLMTIVASPGYALHAQFYDDYPGAATPYSRLVGASVITRQYQYWMAPVLLDATGNYDYDGFSPSDGALPTDGNPFNSYAWFTFNLPSTVVLPFTLSGHIMDVDMPAQPAPGATLCLYDMNGLQCGTSGSDGAYTLAGTLNPVVSVGNQPVTCTAKPVDMSPAALLAAQCTLQALPTHFNTGLAGIQPDPAFTFDHTSIGWDPQSYGNGSFGVQGLPTLNTWDYTARLAAYEVAGHVTEGGNPVAGLRVTDSATNAIVGLPTNAAGFYSGWVTVQTGRKLGLVIGNNQAANGFTYTGASATVDPLPIPATPYTPLTVDFAVGKVGGGGGL